MGHDAERQTYLDLIWVLEDLLEANEKLPILVEGRRDVRALRELGCPGEILNSNTGRSRTQMATELRERGVTDIILLPDWDRKGWELLDSWKALFRGEDIHPHTSIHKRIGTVAKEKLKDVESMARWVARRQNRFGIPYIGFQQAMESE